MDSEDRKRKRTVTALLGVHQFHWHRALPGERHNCAHACMQNQTLCIPKLILFKQFKKVYAKHFANELFKKEKEKAAS